MIIRSNDPESERFQLEVLELNLTTRIQDKEALDLLQETFHGPVGPNFIITLWARETEDEILALILTGGSLNLVRLTRNDYGEWQVEFEFGCPFDALRDINRVSFGNLAQELQAKGLPVWNT